MQNGKIAGGTDQELDFGHVGSEMSVGHPSADTEESACYLSLEFRGDMLADVCVNLHASTSAWKSHVKL